MAASARYFPQIYAAPENVPSSSSSPQPQPQPHPQPQPQPQLQLQLPSTSEIVATVQHPSSSAEPSAAAAARLPEHMMYKNRLQEFAQKSSIALPMYQTVSEGTPHAPMFRSTVWVNEKSYTTPITFSNRKSAEQDAARLALESLPKVIKDEGSPLVWENTLFSKSILNEYATKLNVARPTYNTVQHMGVLPVFVSTLVFNGTQYTGDASRNKKEAEQLAARCAILSILDQPSSGTLFEIIKSKSRIFSAVRPNISQSIEASNVSDMANPGLAAVSLDHKDKEVAGIVTANNNETKIELPVSSNFVSDAQTQVAFHEAPVLPNVTFQTASEHPIGDGSSSKKRRKNKKKANKKARLESSVSVAVFPVKCE